MPTSAVNTFDSIMLQPYYPTGKELEIQVKLPVSIEYAAGTILGEQIGTNEIVTVTISGIPTGGTFTLTFGGQTTAAIALGASSLLIQQAFEALSTVGDGNANVTASWSHQGGTIRIEFRGTLGATNVGAVTCDVGSLTGGSAAQSVTVTTAGATGTAGTFKAYDNDATDGSERACCILKYKCTTDSSGNITVGGGEHTQTSLTAPAYTSGAFLTSDLTGLDSVAVEQLGRLVSGTVASGVLQLK